MLTAAERQASQQLLNGVSAVLVVQEEGDDRTNDAQAGESTKNTQAFGASRRTIVRVLVSGRRSGVTGITRLARGCRDRPGAPEVRA